HGRARRRRVPPARRPTRGRPRDAARGRRAVGGGDPRAVRLRPMGTLRATQHRENREVDDPARRPDAPLSPPPAPLWRNRDFVLLQGGQLLSNVGTQLTSIAYPLLVLAVTHSAAKAGIVGFARSIPYPLFGML